MAYIVYKHTSPSNKVYIGITGQGIKKRWRDGEGYKRCPYFYKAILKYGWDNITHEILYEDLTEEEACELEQKLIAEYKATDPQYGYNDLIGGQSGKHGRPPTEEHRAKMRENTRRNWADPNYRAKVLAARRSYTQTEEHKAHISQSLIGKNVWSKGRKLSKEHCQKISERNKRMGIKPPSWKGKHHTEEAKRKIGEAHRGFNPFYAHPISPEGSQAIREKNIRIFSKPIRQLKDGVVIAEYSSMKAAAEALGLKNASNISCCLRGITKSAYGFQWEYITKECE